MFDDREHEMDCSVWLRHLGWKQPNIWYEGLRHVSYTNHRPIVYERHLFPVTYYEGTRPFMLIPNLD